LEEGQQQAITPIGGRGALVAHFECFFSQILLLFLRSFVRMGDDEWKISPWPCQRRNSEGLFALAAA
jgi:hypothetical protein